MATSNATRSLPLLGSYVELVERLDGGTRHASGTVTAVVVVANPDEQEEALLINEEWWHFFNCEILKVVPPAS